ncbi:MAG: histidine phosphatase family protein [Gammaproteobacteria bacterium]
MFVDYIRHGMPVGGGRYRGQIDDPLSDLGWAQMRATAAEEQDWTRLVSSPLCRCLAFANELSEQRGLPLEVDERLREVGFGDWEGMSGAEIDERWPDARRAFYKNPIEGRPAGAEALADFSARCADAWEDITSRYVDDHVLVVAHAGVIRATLAYVLGMPLERLYRLQVANASLTRIRLTESRPPEVMFHGRNVAKVSP